MFGKRALGSGLVEWNIEWNVEALHFSSTGMQAKTGHFRYQVTEVDSVPSFVMALVVL
jgi:hypothetical protein